jgi:[NiFe] hydrogenase assembly HybE family chaperone
MAESPLPQAARVGPIEQVERVFGHIAATRMAGLPLNNPALRVEAVGFRLWQGDWLGVLVTPWAISLMLLPGGSGAFRELGADERQCWRFPSGAYDFMGSCEATLGPYQLCSLFSPAFEFATHEAACATAHAALDSLLEPAAAAEREKQREQARLAGVSVLEQAASETGSRRDFLRGSFLRGHS